jgi:hypothetical protein
MKKEMLKKLSRSQVEAMVIAFIVRGEMENFHIKHLSQAQMKELNILIRQGIYNGLEIIRRAGKLKKNKWGEIMSAVFVSIPDYWEAPNDEAITKISKTMEEL